MSFYTAVCSRALFPLHERLKGHASVAVRERLETSQWWPRLAIEDDRIVRLRRFLIDAGTRVPYYHDLFRQHRFDPSDMQSVADLGRLPLLGKPEIRTHVERLKATGHGRLKRYNTGGSSGEPLIFFIGRDRVTHDVAAKWRATRWWGVDIGDPEMVVWGSPIELGAQDRIRGIRDKVLRTELLPAFEMSDAKLDGFIAAIRRRRPRMLFGYPSALSHIARHAEKRGTALDDLGIKVAFVTSELLYDDQRATIGRVFGCQVANGYGSRDAGFIAHECASGGMHLTAEDIVVETVGADGLPVPEGQPGEIVVTHLATRDFPFIRYRTGDFAVLDAGTCACGRGLPLIKELQGRSTDLRGGRRRHRDARAGADLHPARRARRAVVQDRAGNCSTHDRATGRRRHLRTRPQRRDRRRLPAPARCVGAGGPSVHGPYRRRAVGQIPVRGQPRYRRTAVSGCHA